MAHLRIYVKQYLDNEENMRFTYDNYTIQSHLEINGLLAVSRWRDKRSGLWNTLGISKLDLKLPQIGIGVESDKTHHSSNLTGEKP